MTYTVFFKNAGVPATGLTPVWSSLRRVSDTTTYLPLPTITEIGGGFYKFVATPSEALVGVIDGGIALPAADRYSQVVIPIGLATSFGSVPVTVTFNDTVNSVPIPDVECVVLNQDESIIVNSGLSNSMGQLQAQLNPGAYVLRMRKDGWNFTVPYSFVVSGPTMSIAIAGSNVGDIEASLRKVVVPKDLQY
jgi:hypothetical protein